MGNNLKVKEENQAQAVARMLDSLLALVNDPEFLPTYHDKRVHDINTENERLFGAADLEMLSFFHTAICYQNTTVSVETSSSNCAKGFACDLLSFELYSADLSYVVSNNKSYNPIGPEVCLIGFARAISYGQMDVADWWAVRLEEIALLNPNYLLDSFYDPQLITHLLLLSRCWKNRVWPSVDEVEALNLGSYQPLWKCSKDTVFLQSVLSSCSLYHLKEGFENQFSPFGSVVNGLYPLELLSWMRLYKEIFHQDLSFPNHPLFTTTIVRGVKDIPLYSDEWLDSIRNKAKNFYGKHWVPYRRQGQVY